MFFDPKTRAKVKPSFIPIVVKNSKQAAEIRTWTSLNRKYTVKARLVSVSEGISHLETEDGNAVKVPIDKLVQEDRNSIEENQ